MDKIMDFNSFVNENYMVNEGVLDWVSKKMNILKKLIKKQIDKLPDNKLSQLKSEISEYKGMSFNDVFKKLKEKYSKEDIERMKLEYKKTNEGMKGIAVIFAIAFAALFSAGTFGDVNINWGLILGVVAAVIVTGGAILGISSHIKNKKEDNI